MSKGERLRWCERTGLKTQKNNVACHGAESTPKIHSPALLSRVQGCLNIAMHGIPVRETASRHAAEGKERNSFTNGLSIFRHWRNCWSAGNLNFAGRASSQDENSLTVSNGYRIMLIMGKICHFLLFFFLLNNIFHLYQRQ